LLKNSTVQAESRLTLWNLSLFHSPELRDEAVFNACEADLILLSLRGDRGLERQTENWLTHWLARRGDEECALACLIHGNLPAPDPVNQSLIWLQQAMRPTQVQLFVGFMPPVTSDAAAPAVSDESEPLHFIPGTVPHPLDRHAEGGLNE
jgi:hypothetical protein